MKKYIIVFTIAFVFGACQTKQDKKVNGNLVPIDTTLFYNNSILSDTAKMKSADSNVSVKKTVTTTTTTIEPLGNGKSAVVNDKALAPKRKSTLQRKGRGATYVEPAPVKPKGMSSAAKGAVIGGAGGALIGGVIGHNVKGAVIGGVVGGGAGYAIGRAKDRRTGRVAQGRAYRRHKKKH